LLHRNGTHIGTSLRPNNGRSRFMRFRPSYDLNFRQTRAIHSLRVES